MRYSITTLALALLVSVPAHAQNAPERGAGATAQPQLPAVVSNPASGTPEKAAPGSVPPASDFKEPDLKHKGGKTTSSLIKDAPLKDDYVLGNASAPLVIVEYASLSCPHCAHFSNTVLPELQKKYIDTGKMRYVLRPFPLNEPALKGAMLLDCVGEQNKEKYYVFAKVLFEAQNKWAFDTNFLSGLETIATVGGVSKDQFQACVNNTDREVKILKMKKLATDELKVPHTPYIFIGDEAYDGDRSLESVSKAIDAKLAKGGR